MANPQVAVDIRANDKTGPGAKSAEKRLGQIPRHVSAAERAYASQSDRMIGRSSRSILRTFGAVEQASARAFGGRSLTAGFASRLGDVSSAASAVGSGLGEAALAGGVLRGALAAVGVTAGATIGVMAAAGYAAFKLADGWSKGAAAIGRTASIIGVATKALQEFNAAAERQGVDTGTSTSAVAGLSQSLNDARYGRNNDVIALLSRMGVRLQMNADGTVNTGAMLPAIADALARQNSSGRRTAARILGIPDAALPAFTQGGKALSADMREADGTAVVLSDKGIARGTRIARKTAMLGQLKDRGLALAGIAAADNTEGGLDSALDTGRGIVGGTTTFGGVVRNTFAPAVETFKQAVGLLSGRSGSTSGSLADRIEKLGERSRQNQVSPKGAVGVMQVMPATAREQAKRMGIPFDEHRYRTDADYNRMLGQGYLRRLRGRYDGDEVLTTAAFNAGPGAVDRWIRAYGDPRKGEISDRDFWKKIPGHGPGTYQETRDYVGRVVYGEAPAQQHHHKHEIHVHPGGVTVKTSTRGSDGLTVSHADVGR